MKNPRRTDSGSGREFDIINQSAPRNPWQIFFNIQILFGMLFVCDVHLLPKLCKVAGTGIVRRG